MSKIKNRALLTVFLGIMSAMAPLATDMYLPSLPIMQAEFGISTSLIQMTLTMTMLGMAIGQIFAGPISDMRGRKMPLLAGMLVFMITSAICIVADNIVIFLAARFVQGFAGACGIVISRAIARDVCQGPELFFHFDDGKWSGSYFGTGYRRSDSYIGLLAICICSVGPYWTGDGHCHGCI